MARRRRPVAPGKEPDDPIERARLRRRDPNERWLSRVSGILLLVMITQAAFGYTLVGLSAAAWVRNTHFLVGLLVAGLAVGAVRFARRLPWGGRREAVLVGLTMPLVVLVFLQLLMGAIFRGLLPGYSTDVRTVHIALGFVVLFLVTLIHVVAIAPSLLLSARREHTAARDRLGR